MSSATDVAAAAVIVEVTRRVARNNRWTGEDEYTHTHTHTHM